MFFWKRQNLPEGEKIVMCFGTFDLLHAGHENFFQQAKELGDFLIVVLARDNTVQNIKGRAPLHDEKNRKKNLTKTGWADLIVLGNHDDKHKIILKYKPHIIALGYDQFVFTQTLQKTIIENSLDTEIIRLESFHPEVYKSSLIRANLAQHEK